MENCVDSPFVKNFGCIIFAFRASLDWLTLQVIKLVRMGDYYRVTNLWLLLYYREFRRLKITVMLVWEKVRLDLPQSSSQLQRVRLGGASRHTTLVTTKAVSPSCAALVLTEAHSCPWAGGILRCSHPDSRWSSKAAVCCNGNCSPVGSYAGPSEQRQALCTWSRGAEGTVASLGVLSRLWARILFPSPDFPPGASLLSEMQVRVEFPPGKCLTQTPAVTGLQPASLF